MSKNCNVNRACMLQHSVPEFSQILLGRAKALEDVNELKVKERVSNELERGQCVVEFLLTARPQKANIECGRSYSMLGESFVGSPEVPRKVFVSLHSIAFKYHSRRLCMLSDRL